MMGSPDVGSWIAAAQRDPRAWLYEADRLKRAADLVASQFQGEANEWLKLALAEDDEEAGRDQAFQLGMPAMMLIGYAIEVLAKGLIIAVDSTDETVKRISRSHIDAALLERAGAELISGDASSSTRPFTTRFVGRAGTRCRGRWTPSGTQTWSPRPAARSSAIPARSRPTTTAAPTSCSTGCGNSSQARSRRATWLPARIRVRDGVAFATPAPYAKR
jgi:hypothetical protein